MPRHRYVACQCSCATPILNALANYFPRVRFAALQEELQKERESGGGKTQVDDPELQTECAMLRKEVEGLRRALDDERVLHDQQIKDMRLAAHEPAPAQILSAPVDNYACTVSGLVVCVLLQHTHEATDVVCEIRFGCLAIAIDLCSWRNSHTGVKCRGGGKQRGGGRQY